MSRIPREVGRNPGSVQVWVVGIDPSPTSTGIAVIPPGWELGHWPSLCVTSYGLPEPTKYDDPERTERARVDRLSRVATRVVEEVIGFLPIPSNRFLGGVEVRGFIEGYAHNMAGGAHAALLRELGGILRDRFIDRLDLPLVPVTESSARKLLLGKCPPKDRKMVTYSALWDVGARFSNADESDAFAVANWGLSEVGLTALSLA